MNIEKINIFVTKSKKHAYEGNSRKWINKN